MVGSTRNAPHRPEETNAPVRRRSEEDAMRRSLALLLAGLVVGVAMLAVSNAQRSSGLERPPFRMAHVVLRQDDLETATTVAA